LEDSDFRPKIDYFLAVNHCNFQLQQHHETGYRLHYSEHGNKNKTQPCAVTAIDSFAMLDIVQIKAL